VILVTGATGFVGKALVSCLSSNGMDVLGAVRKESSCFPNSVQQVVIGDLSTFGVERKESMSPIFDGVEVVIHAAARVHVMCDDSTGPLDRFRKVNRDATLVLAHQAAKAGVKRFVFLSSIKVSGEMTLLEQRFTEKNTFVPTDPYGLSKYEAEQGLLKLAEETAMEVVIIRPPLVYGPGVRANFASMIKWMQKEIPLPFGAIHNRRSLVALDNLVDFIALCADREKSPKAANEVFLISDNEDVSTTQLLSKVASAFGKKPWLMPVPVSWMTFAAKLLGKEDVAVRLFSSLQVDSSKARDLLGWKPVITMDEQLKKIAGAEKNEKSI